MAEPIAPERTAKSNAATGNTVGSLERNAHKQSLAPAKSPRAESSREFYRTRDVVEMLGISRRQLQYWAQTELVVPSQRTRGGHHRYSFEDLVSLKAAKRLIDAGVSVQRIRSSIRSLREVLPKVERPLAELVLVATGDVVLVFLEGTAFEAVSGQEWVFEVAQFQREIEDWRRKTRSPKQSRKTGAAAAEPVRRARSVRRSTKQIQTA